LLAAQVITVLAQVVDDFRSGLRPGLRPGLKSGSKSGLKFGSRSGSKSDNWEMGPGKENIDLSIVGSWACLTDAILAD